mmetsp:Transcript_22115/g.57718  ORF Transcript_22115/g.57718 Transcript_22115/m.57718 type:complete len:196 (-) Transcript_22115:327-914(-)
MTIQHIMEGNGNRRLVRVVAVETVEVSVAVAVLVEVDVAAAVVVGDADGLTGAADVALAPGVVVPKAEPLALALVVMTCMPLSGAVFALAALGFACPFPPWPRLRVMELFSLALPALAVVLAASPPAAAPSEVVLSCSSGCARGVVDVGCLARPDALAARCFFAARRLVVVPTSSPPTDWLAASLLHQAFPQPSQ